MNMKYIITERQLKLIKEDKIRKIDFDIFNNNWDLLQKFLERRGNPPYIIIGDLNLAYSNIESLGNLQSVGGFLNLYKTKIVSLGKLQSVGGFLALPYTPLSNTTTEEEIRIKVEVEGGIYM